MTICKTILKCTEHIVVTINNTYNVYVHVNYEYKNKKKLKKYSLARHESVSPYIINYFDHGFVTSINFRRHSIADTNSGFTSSF